MRSFIFKFFVFLYTIMYIVNIASTNKKMSVNEIREFILKPFRNELQFLKNTVIIQWNIRKKDLQLFPIKLTEKIADPRNVKQH